MDLKLRLYTGGKNMDRTIISDNRLMLHFIDSFCKEFPNIPYNAEATDGDEGIFGRANIQYIPPCLRETAAIIEKARKHKLPALIQPGDIKAIIHSHSNWSDGVNTIEEMANECIQRGFEYLVISDHSKSAAYANGLSEERIREQHRYIDELNAKLAPFKIFKSIECDILNDGSLDYPNDVLANI